MMQHPRLFADLRRRHVLSRRVTLKLIAKAVWQREQYKAHNLVYRQRQAYLARLRQLRDEAWNIDGDTEAAEEIGYAVTGVHRVAENDVPPLEVLAEQLVNEHLLKTWKRALLKAQGIWRCP